MRCPNCCSTLQPITYEGVLLHTCNGCGGEFVAGDALSHIVRVREERFGPEVAAEVAESRPVFGFPAAERARRHTCPGCGDTMRSFNYSVDSGIHVDRCAVCSGVWLDKGELEKIQALMERWHDEAPEKVRAAAFELERARREAAAAGEGAFAGSRFAFVNAMINHLVDAA